MHERKLVAHRGIGTVTVQRIGRGRAAAGEIRLAHRLEVYQERPPDGPHYLVSVVNIQGFRAEMRLQLQNGRVVVSELHVTPEGQLAAGGMTSRLLRYIPVHALAGKLGPMLANESARSQLETLLIGTGLEEILDVRQPVPLTDTSRVRGRRPIADETLLDVADAYARAVQAGSSQPTRDAAKEVGMKIVRARDYVHRARKRGLLTDVPQGRPGGELTPLAEAIKRFNEQRRATAPAPRRKRRR